MKKLLIALLVAVSAFAVPAFSQTKTRLDTLTVGNLNGQFLFVDGVKFLTCDAAIAAAGSNNVIVIIPFSYTGPDCTLPIASNIIPWNFRNNTEYPQGVTWFYTSSGNTESLVHFKGQRSAIKAGGAFVTGYFTSTLNNYVHVSGIGMDGTSSEANTTGTFSGTLPTLQGAENNITIGSTGGAITNLTGLVGYANTLVASTTAITTVIGVRGLGCNSILGVIPVNCYGVFADRQLGQGSARNYALGVNGAALVLYDSNIGKAGFDVEDTSHTIKSWMYLDSSNNFNIQAPQTQGIFFRDSTAAAQATIDSTGLGISAQANFTEQATRGGIAGKHVIWGGSDDHMLHFNPNNSATQNVPVTAFVTSAYTNATTTFSTVTNMSWSIAANRNYKLSCEITWQGSATTTGPKFQLTGPASPTAVALDLDSAVTATTTLYAAATAFSSAVANTGTVTATTNLPAHILAEVVNGANAGTLVLQAAANGAGTLTIQPGSSCQLQ